MAYAYIFPFNTIQVKIYLLLLHTISVTGKMVLEAFQTNHSLMIMPVFTWCEHSHNQISPNSSDVLNHWPLGELDAISGMQFSNIFRIGIFRSFFDNVVCWMPRHLINDKSMLVQVMACSRQATSRYLSQCWPRSLGLNELKVSCLPINDMFGSRRCHNIPWRNMIYCASWYWILYIEV